MIKRYTFEEIKVKGTRRWTDDNGKKRQKTNPKKSKHNKIDKS